MCGVQCVLRKLAGRPRLQAVSWLAPECFRGEGLSKFSDVYAFGILMWELYTGQVRRVLSDSASSSQDSGSWRAELWLSAGSLECCVCALTPPLLLAAAESECQNPACVASPACLHYVQVAFDDLVTSNTKVLQTIIGDGVRPQFPDAAPAWYVNLATRCWAGAPKSRPSFRRIVQALQSVEEPPAAAGAAPTATTVAAGAAQG
jgi:hypothetical protein